MVSTRSAHKRERISHASLYMGVVKRRKKESSPAPSMEIFAGLPMELKLMIIDMLDSEPQVLSFKYKPCFSRTVRHPRCFWIAKPINPPLALSICSATRSTCLSRYATLPAPYDNVHVNYERDIFRIIQMKSGRMIPSQHALMSIHDMIQVQNVMLVQQPKDDWFAKALKMFEFKANLFPGVKNIYPDPHWAGNRTGRAYEKARDYAQNLPTRDLDGVVIHGFGAPAEQG